MTEQSFSLIPFPAPAIPEITITGTISRQNNFFEVRYALVGNLDQISLPLPSVNTGRKDDLWKATCFEIFMAWKDQPQYWEFNMSASGDWNVYRMDAYRRIGFREETSIQQLPLEIQREDHAWTVVAAIDLNPIFQQNEDLEIGITAVIQTRDGKETYWALTHPAPHADFHLRESFILALAPQTRPLGQSAPGD
jgi:hypothetical protein